MKITRIASRVSLSSQIVKRKISEKKLQLNAQDVFNYHAEADSDEEHTPSVKVDWVDVEGANFSDGSSSYKDSQESSEEEYKENDVDSSNDNN